MAQRIGSDARRSTALSNLSLVELDVGSPERAMSLLQEAIDIDRRLGNSWATVVAQGNLAGALVQAGRAADAQQLLCSLIDHVATVGDVELTADTLERFAAAAAELGADARAAHLSGAAERIREVAGMPIAAPDRALLERATDRARARMPAADWKREVSVGRRLTQGEALALAGESLDI